MPSHKPTYTQILLCAVVVGSAVVIGLIELYVRIAN